MTRTSAAAEIAAGRPERLNVLLITADQHRGDFLGAAGHPVVRTPHLDALAAAGAYFPNAYSPVPVCVPARYAIMTGQVPTRFRVRGNTNAARIPSDTVALPDVFGAAGYATAAIGKMHFSPWHDPHGFQTFVVSEEGRQWRDTTRHPEGGDDYQRYLREVGWGGYERAHGIGNNDVHTSASPLPLEHYHTSWCARTAAQWIRDHVAREGPAGNGGGASGVQGGGAAGGVPGGLGVAGRVHRPFFVWCSFTKPHSPYDPPEPYDRLYDPRTFPPPAGDAGDLEGLSPSYVEGRNSHLFDALGPEIIQRARAFYAGNVTLIDHMVGHLRQTLAELGIADRTVICYTADHGDLLGDHGLFFKANYFRASWHVPFVLYAPGRLEGQGQVPRFVTTPDVYPTLLSLAGVPLPDGARLDGAAVSEDLHGGPDTVFGSVRRPPQQIHAARTRGPMGAQPEGPERPGEGSSGWSYVVHAQGAYEELYDLATDPGERRNLAGSPDRSPAVDVALGELRGRLERWLAGLGDTESLDAAGRLRLDPAARGWSPSPPPRTGLGLRPY
jgi:arylsulfatase A-like enzyme